MHKVIKIIGKTLWLTIMMIIAAIMLYPFLYSLMGALNSRYDFGHLGSLLPIPKKIELGNFGYAFSAAGIKPFLNTFFRTSWYTWWTVLIAVLM